MILTAENYYSEEADREYISVSQFKDFAGTTGRLACEYTAMEKMAGRWKQKETVPMLVGSYVDAWFEGTLESFQRTHRDIFTASGDLKAPYRGAERIINRVSQDRLFMQFMGGEKQVIMTGELFGAKWKIKMDSFIPEKAIVDLKVVKAVNGKEAYEWVRDFGYMYFALYWGYDIQGAIYQEIVRQNTGMKLPFYLAAVSKQEEPDIEVRQVTDNYLREALAFVETHMQRVLAIKNGEIEPHRCELCDCCRRSKVLKWPTPIPEVPMGA